ncbi:MAG: LysR family transcriptional regulator, partial [Myxococcota bacterium]
RELRGSLRISSLDIVFELWRADLLELQQQLPRVELVLLDQTHVVDLARREADVAIRFAIAPPEHLVGRRHVELFYAVYASAQLVERVTDGGARTARYADYPWIGWDGMFAAATDRVVQQHAPGAAIPLRINSLALLGRSIEDGIGVSVMPCFYGDRQPGLVRLGDYFEGGMYFWVLTHEQLRRTARVRAFTDFVARLIERDRPLFLGRSPAAPTVAVATS